MPWQQSQWQHLLHARAQGRLPHALLLHGQAGLGKRAFAEGLAKVLLCQREDDIACGECSACLQFAADNSADYFCIEPPDDKTVINVDQIRALIEALSLTSHGGGRRVVIIDPADAMNASAANSLLKTLEEPPGASVLLLVSAQPARLPATVRSRCRQVRFTPPGAEQATQWLEDAGVAADQAAHLVALSGARPLKALALQDQQVLSRNAWVREALQGVVEGSRNPVGVCAELAKQSVAEGVELLMIWTGERIRAYFKPAAGDAAPGALDLTQLYALHDRLYKAEQLRNTSVNQQLLLESILIPLAPDQRPRPTT